MSKSALALILLFVVGCIVVVSGLVTGRPAAPVVAPAPTVTAPAPEPVARPAKREKVVPVAAAPEKKAAAAAEIEARFADFREEGRRLRQMLTESDPKAGQAFGNAAQSPDYRALTERRHELERNWASATDAEKGAILAEMNAIRERTTGMVMTELAKLNAAPAAPVTTLQRTEPGRLSLGTDAAPNGQPAAPPAPVVIM
ncbi:MAG: hypothetical protein RL250_866 [Verrucomicrobiota bacterium]